MTTWTAPLAGARGLLHRDSRPLVGFSWQDAAVPNGPEFLILVLLSPVLLFAIVYLAVRLGTRPHR